MPRSPTIRIEIVAVAMGFLALTSMSAADDGRFRRLRSDAIRTTFAGRSVGDDAHWAYHFEPNGVLDVMDLGRRYSGRWRVSRGELCMDVVSKGKTETDCYEPWISGGHVRFERDGITVFEGSFQAPLEPHIKERK